MPCIPEEEGSGKPGTMPISQRSGEPDATTFSKELRTFRHEPPAQSTSKQNKTCGTYVEVSAKRHRSGGSNRFFKYMWVALKDKQKLIMKLLKQKHIYFDETAPRKVTKVLKNTKLPLSQSQRGATTWKEMPEK